jgi:hypothetical protein
MQLSLAYYDEWGHFYVMGCQLIRRRRQLGPIGPLHKRLKKDLFGKNEKIIEIYCLKKIRKF